jgi:hypothetical protein
MVWPRLLWCVVVSRFARLGIRLFRVTTGDYSYTIGNNVNLKHLSIIHFNLLIYFYFINKVNLIIKISLYLYN